MRNGDAVLVACILLLAVAVAWHTLITHAPRAEKRGGGEVITEEETVSEEQFQAGLRLLREEPVHVGLAGPLTSSAVSIGEEGPLEGKDEAESVEGRPGLLIDMRTGCLRLWELKEPPIERLVKYPSGNMTCCEVELDVGRRLELLSAGVSGPSCYRWFHVERYRR